MTRLLLVDDDPTCRLPTLIMLQRRGYDVDVADNGATALAMISQAEEPYDVIILDLFMPVMDGYEFLQAYRGSARIVVLSGWADLDETILPSPPAATIAKPYNTVELCETIQRLMAA
jgi:CheY-like chemotaxis protein